MDAGLAHSDLTGRFPTTSLKGNTYVLFLYDYETNNILTESMKSRGDQEMRSEPTTNSSKSLLIMVLNRAYSASTMNVHMHSTP
jgi:hypothetical protein